MRVEWAAPVPVMSDPVRPVQARGVCARRSMRRSAALGAGDDRGAADAYSGLRRVVCDRHAYSRRGQRAFIEEDVKAVPRAGGEHSPQARHEVPDPEPDESPDLGRVVGHDRDSDLVAGPGSADCFLGGGVADPGNCSGQALRVCCTVTLHLWRLRVASDGRAPRPDSIRRSSVTASWPSLAAGMLRLCRTGPDGGAGVGGGCDRAPGA